MVNKHQKFWNKKHFEEVELSKINRPSTFVAESLKYFPKEALILELGTGTGQDTHFLIEHGFQVVATDFSKPALTFTFKAAKPEYKNKLAIKQFDLSDHFPFADESFDIVYAHLVIHYFNKRTTQQIFDEIFRVLKQKGIIAILVNSSNDSDFGIGRKLEEDYFEVLPGRPKRFFSVDSIREFIGRFHIIILDNKGSDLRRDHKDNLIRFIGKKN